MIWESTLVMTLVHLLVIGVVGWALGFYARDRARFAGSGVGWGLAAVGVGLLLAAVFYLADLLARLALPHIIGPAAARSVMQALHLDYSWIVIPASIVLAVVGFAVSSHQLLEAAVRARRSEESLRAESEALERSAAQASAVELKLGRLLDATAGAVIMIDRKGRIHLINPAAERVFGYSAGELDGEPLEMLLPLRFRDAHREHIERFRASDEVARAMTSRSSGIVGLRKDQTEFAAEASITKLAPGSETELAVILYDVTERREREEQLRQALKLEAVGQLTGGIAHDFNNLLTVIQGNLELADDRLPGGTGVARFVRQAADAARRGADLTHRLLAYSRKQALEPEVLDLSRLVGGMADLLGRTLGEAVEIEIVSAGSLWKCEADRSQVENALLNLAINARDAMPQGGKLTIELGNVRLDPAYARRQVEVEAGQYVMLAVTDSGVGMPPEMVERAFDPFFTTKETGSGSGLGLSMVHGFVKQSRGHVKVYSELGQGTSVKIYLPRVNTGDPASAEPLRDIESPGAGELILVVEDDEAVRLSVEAMLTGSGYEPLGVATAAEGLESLAQRPEIALLLTDVVLPGSMNGRDLAQAARVERPDLEVLFMSGYTENAIVHQGRLDPGVELLQKPFRRQELARRVHALLHRKSDDID